MWGGDKEGGAVGVFLSVGSRLRDSCPFPHRQSWQCFLSALTIPGAEAGAELFGRCVGVSGSLRESLLPTFSGIWCPARELCCAMRSELGVLIARALPRRSFPGLPAAWPGAGMVIPADPNSSLLF